MNWCKLGLHKWSAWQDATGTFEIRNVIFNTSRVITAECQIRVCERCKKREVVRL